MDNEAILDDSLFCRNRALERGFISDFWMQFPTFEQFCQIMNLDYNSQEALIHWSKCGHIQAMFMGKIADWWELSWDHFGMEGELIPLHVVVREMDKLEFDSFPPLLTELKLFKSNKDAKNNGWNRKIEKGDFFFKKKTYILRII